MKLYLGVKGCSDHACILQDNSSGMHTNGGCMCEKDIMRGSGVTGRYAVRTIRMLREELKTAEAEIERLEQENGCVANNAIACTETLRRERQEFRAEIERLSECSTQRGARMQEMYAALKWSTDVDPTLLAIAKEWFDEDGVPK